MRSGDQLTAGELVLTSGGQPQSARHHRHHHHHGGAFVATTGFDAKPPDLMPQNGLTKPTATPQSTSLRFSAALDLEGSSSSPAPAALVIGPARPTRESVLERLSEALLRRSLTKIDLSQRGLQPSDARLVKMALLQNAHLTVLKLGYNNLEDQGAALLATGISKHEALESLDLGFNNIGDQGCCALAKAIRSPPLRTLYLAGNSIREDGAIALADLIRQGSSLQKLYLTGNRLGPNGVRAIAEAIVEAEERRMRPDNGRDTRHFLSDGSLCPALEELFLGGSSMGSSGCRSVAQLVRSSQHLRVLSLPNCELSDDDISELADGLKESRSSLPLETLQLSFNQISCKGMESVVNAIWGSQTLKELLLDNNQISDQGAQQLAAVMPYLENLERIDVAFNSIKTGGMKTLMSTIADTKHLKSLSLSGNPVDAISAKAIAYALAFNRSLLSLSLVNCSTEQNIKRQITAGIVSNNQISIREFEGFDLGPSVVSLGFPVSVGHWTNEQVLNFIHTMWENFGESAQYSEEEKTIDPLHFLNGNESERRPPPVAASVVVDVANRAFNSLVQEGYDVFSRRPGHPSENMHRSPLGNFLVFETGEQEVVEMGQHNASSECLPTNNVRSFVAPPETSKSKEQLPDAARKKRIVEWLCTNIQNLNKLGQQPFSSAELWRLHQYYFTPVVNESGGSVFTLKPPVDTGNMTISSVPEVSMTVTSHNDSDSTDDVMDPASDPSLKQSPTALGSFSMLKRKVSYRFLGDAALSSSNGAVESRQVSQTAHFGVSSLIGGTQGASMPRKTKRARRNRSRISFLPRVKTKLDSNLDVCHEKALVVMRQLYYVEQAILSGEVNPIDPSTTTRTHLSADFATDAETIIVDMI